MTDVSVVEEGQNSRREVGEEQLLTTNAKRKVIDFVYFFSKWSQVE